MPSPPGPTWVPMLAVSGKYTISISGKLSVSSFLNASSFLRLHRSIGKAYFQFPCLMERREAGVDIVFQSVQHTLEGGFHAAGFGVGLQFSSLDSENGFYS